jgi:uncharacterized protein YdeI (YjbR/CyaY-like superfamily)
MSKALGKKDSRIDGYIAQAAPFARPILKHLRKVVHAGCPQIEETIKWSRPHFDFKGPVCGMAAFKEHCVFGFWKQALIFPGDETKMEAVMGHFGSIKSLDDLPNEKTLAGYVRKAAELNEKGVKLPPRPRAPKKAIAVPPDLSAALAKNKKAQQAFENFSPSHRREYVEWITGAKREETRTRRLQTAIEWMAEGKVHNWRYC